MPNDTKPSTVSILDALYIRASNLRKVSDATSDDLCAMVQSTELARETDFADLTNRAENLLYIARQSIEACDRAIAAFVEQACDDMEEKADRELRPMKRSVMGGGF